MKISVLVFLSLLFMISEAKHEFTETAKACVEEVKTDEDTIRGILPEDKPFPEDNELVEKFFDCIFRSNVNDKNELVIDKNLESYVIKILTIRLNGKVKLAGLIARDCLDHCKGLKGDNKGKTAVKVINCVKERFFGYMNEKN